MIKRIISIIYLLLAGAAICFTIPRVEEINDPKMGFNLVIPDGYYADPNILAAKKDIAYAYRRDAVGSLGVTITVRPLPGPIAQDKLADRLPKNFAGRIVPIHWGEYELEAVELPDTAAGEEIVNYNVQVPLRWHAIQLTVVGPLAHKDEMRELTGTLLDNLQGESNWPVTRSPPIAPLRWRGFHIALAYVIGLVAGFGYFIYLQRTARKSTVIVLAALLFLGSMSIYAGERMDTRATAQAFQLLGLLALLMGIFNIFRPVKASARENAAAQGKEA